nr:FAD-binding oxidoreductase [Devosia salina]
MRDRALFDLAIDSKLRGCDLVKLKIGTLVTGHDIRARAMVIQQKTGRPVQFEITSDARTSLLAWLERRGGSVEDFVFPRRADPNDGQAAGNILACRAVPLTDVAVAWSNDQVVAGARVRIVALHTMAPEIYRLVLRPDEPIAFSPGQFFEIELAPGITRSYSVASEQGALELEFHIRAIAGGRASGLLAEERELGDAVRVSGPFGSAIGADQATGPILAIAASTGHAPVQSILNSNDGRRVHLVSFARQREGFYLNGLFARAAEADTRFTYQAIMTGAVARNSSASPLAEAIRQLDCDLLSGQVYIAGPPGFVDAAAELVSARQCLTGVILTDRFELSAAAAAS